MVVDIMMCATVVAAAIWYIWDSKYSRDNDDDDDDGELEYTKDGRMRFTYPRKYSYLFTEDKDRKVADYSDREKFPRPGSFAYLLKLEREEAQRKNSGSGEADREGRNVSNDKD